MAHEIVMKSILNKTKRRDPWFPDEYVFKFWTASKVKSLHMTITCIIFVSQFPVVPEEISLESIQTSGHCFFCR